MINGGFESVKIHANGLAALVKSRGGIHALADYPLTMGFTIWYLSLEYVYIQKLRIFLDRTDTIASLIMDSEPYIELDQPSPLEPNRDWATPSPLAFRYQAKLSNFTSLQNFSQETIEIYKVMRHFTAKKDHLSVSHDRLELLKLLDMSARLDRRIVKIIRSEILDPPNQMTVIYKLFGYAAMIHQVMFIRQIPTRVSLSNILSARLRTLLEGIDLTVLQTQYPDMMLWILMLGGVGGVGTPNQRGFAELLADACCAAGVRARTEIAATLADFLWTDQYVGTVSVAFWNDVIAAQSAKGWG
jgi:hypothetical protein